MPGFEERWLAAMHTLPAFPRTLFRLHNFYAMDIAAIAEALATDTDSITLCLAEARRTIHAHHWPRTMDRRNPEEAAMPVARLETRLRRKYRKWLSATMAESGYAGTVPWPDPSGTIEADEEAAARFVVSALPMALRKAVARSHKPDIATVDLWQYALPWRRKLRHRLLQATDEVRRSGWMPFDIWIAERIAPDRCNPHGYKEGSRRRRPLPEDIIAVPTSEMETELAEIPADMQRRFDSLPRLTQDAHMLYNGYGRSLEEVAQRLGIGRRSTRRRIRRATYILCDWPMPSLAFEISFAWKWRWGRVQRQCRGIWAALRD